MVGINNTTRSKINTKRIEKIVSLFLKKFKKEDFAVSVAIISDKKMKRLNFEYRGIDKTTDVLSFRGGEYMTKYLGEIVININEVGRLKKYQAMIDELDLFKGVGKSAQAAYLFDFILVHGLLHLIGYNDETEKSRQEMMKIGQKFLD